MIFSMNHQPRTMNMITRHNYEEYFILYMDNELDAEECRRVEEFVALHPDLKDELDALLQSKLEPEQLVIFEGKEELMRFSDPLNAINMTNYEEWLLLYVDDELNETERKAIEQFATANPPVQQELNLLLKTTLRPETVVFPNKESLYRSEEKVRRIPAWWRMAAAAAIVIAVGTTGLFILNTDKTTSTEGPTAGTDPVKTELTKDNPELAGNNPGQTNEEADNKSVLPTEKVSNTVILASKDNNTDLKKTKEQVVLPESIKKDESFIAENENKGSNNLPLPDQNPNVYPETRFNDVIAKAHSLTKKELTNSPETIFETPVTNNIAKPSFVSTSTPVNGIDEDQPDGKKNKLRGFLRKITRTFEKTTNIDATDEDDRLLVAGLAIKLK